MYFFLVCAGVFGLIIGSFLNVLVLRYKTGRGLSGRSGCPSCGKTLHWYELIPVISFIIQKGRCASCHSKISFQYPLVELLTAGLFVLSAWKAFSVGGVYLYIHFAHLALMMSLLVALVVYDIKHTIIPNFFVYLFDICALAYVFANYSGTFTAPLWSPIVSAAVVAAPFAFLWLVSSGRWMGLGDAKLSLGIGAALSFVGGLSALVWAFWAGALVSLFLLALSKLRLRHRGRHFTMKSEVPFAPFLVFGFLIVLFWSIDLVTLITFIS